MSNNCQNSGTSHNIRGLISNAGAGAAAGNFFVLFGFDPFRILCFSLMGFSQNFTFFPSSFVFGQFCVVYHVICRMFGLTL